ncbi:MAG: efflux RND transporter periplasmic adaptor subunit [Puniceicoccales bacterium]|nr:efflux RND transporter periplasmic adaptor subunit [Puniceicoccales bacterium]
MNASQSDLGTLIKTNGSGKKSPIRTILILVAVVVVGVGGWFYWNQQVQARNAISPYITEPVARGDIALTITATGNLEPTNEITVGSELSGTALEVYADTNDAVTKGQILAKLDTTKLQQQRDSLHATLLSANAKVAQAKATLKETQATLARQQELHRLSGGKVPSRADMDTAIASADRATADLEVAEASVKEAEAQVAINKTDLEKSVIKSPIDGIVLTRSIEPGQTVAASFNTPELFIIAEKLEHMKLKVAVAEADIGRVANGQPATFAVDAWPNRTYSAKVTKVAYGSSVTDNVVTYETELVVSNDDLTLRPGMTATTDIHVAESKGTLLIPASALRFNPDTAMASGQQTGQQQTFVQSLMPGPPRSMTAKRPEGDDGKKASNGDGTAHIWILRDGHPEPLTVKIGLSDGRHVEISGEGVTENLPVIIRATATR